MRYPIILLLIVMPYVFAAPLDDCAEQFINGDISNVPTIGNSPTDEPYGNNQHLCYQDDNVSFFAIEYWPEEFSPRWAAYKLSPDNYGADGCNVYTRDKANCYFQEESWEDFEACEDGSDPFHSDTILNGNKLGANDFSSTGHDRGHIAPRQAFSWHICGTYQTFTMANMSPQKAYFNQEIWQYLERQVLTWAFDHGPIYVVTGSIYEPFPYRDFSVYNEGTLDSQQIYASGSTLKEIVAQHHDNYQTTQKGDILHPKRDGNPAKVKSKTENMKMPTGYFKIIYRPAMNGEPEHVIAFLLPHTFENLSYLENKYHNLPKEQAFWSFTSKVSVIEDASNITFPGLSSTLKNKWGDGFFWNKKGSRNISQGCDGKPQGVLENSTAEERLAACIDKL